MGFLVAKVYIFHGTLIYFDSSFFSSIVSCIIYASWKKKLDSEIILLSQNCNHFLNKWHRSEDFFLRWTRYHGFGVLFSIPLVNLHIRWGQFWLLIHLSPKKFYLVCSNWKLIFFYILVTHHRRLAFIRQAFHSLWWSQQTRLDLDSNWAAVSRSYASLSHWMF